MLCADNSQYCHVCRSQEQPQQQQQQQQQAAPEQQAYSGPSDVILVTDADTPTGELVTLQLILLRWARQLLSRAPLQDKPGMLHDRSADHSQT